MAADADGNARRPYGRHPALVTADRLLDAYKRWPGKFSGEETDAIDVLRVALERIAEEGSRTRPLAPCGTEAAYHRHVRNGEPKDDACRMAHAAAKRAERNGRVATAQEIRDRTGGDRRI